MPESQTEELISLLVVPRTTFARCMVVNSQNAQCFNNHFQICTSGAAGVTGRTGSYALCSEGAATPSGLTQARGKLLDAEQLAMLLYLVQARELE